MRVLPNVWWPSSRGTLFGLIQWIRITFYSGIVHGLAPIRAELQAQMRADDIPED
jgi:hypothetical protein